MSAWENVPTDEDGWSAEETEEWLLGVFRELAGFARDAQMHDRDGYVCHVVGSVPCLALGHKPDDEGQWEDGLDGHEFGFDSDLICSNTRFDTACTYCENNYCEYEPFPSLWSLPGVAYTAREEV